MQISTGLTIGGSDSCGGAGIQADIKTFSALKIYSASVITALTAQNTFEVAEVLPLPKEFVESQLNTVCSDLNVCGIKVGMLGQAEIIEEVADFLESYGCEEVVLDPVMVSQSGHRLLEGNAVEALKKMLPFCRIVTPNLYEASILMNEKMDGGSEEEVIRWSRAIQSMGVDNVLIKGGHGSHPKESSDLLLAGDEEIWIKNVRIDTKNTHGTGCSLSTAICAHLIKGKSIQDSVAAAETYVQKGIVRAKDVHIGRGSGPIDHLGIF